MPEGTFGGWAWMLRTSDCRQSTYRGAGWALTRVRDENGRYWCASADFWWRGARLELRRDEPSMARARAAATPNPRLRSRSF